MAPIMVGASQFTCQYVHNVWNMFEYYVFMGLRL